MGLTRRRGLPSSPPKWLSPAPDRCSSRSQSGNSSLSRKLMAVLEQSSPSTGAPGPARLREGTRAWVEGWTQSPPGSLWAEEAGFVGTASEPPPCPHHLWAQRPLGQKVGPLTWASPGGTGLVAVLLLPCGKWRLLFPGSAVPPKSCQRGADKAQPRPCPAPNSPAAPSWGGSCLLGFQQGRGRPRRALPSCLSNALCVALTRAPRAGVPGPASPSDRTSPLGPPARLR